MGGHGLLFCEKSRVYLHWKTEDCLSCSHKIIGLLGTTNVKVQTTAHSRQLTRALVQWTFVPTMPPVWRCFEESRQSPPE